jgi:predicted RNA binding protein YcfA (HicA-like mRNA interferase family)
VTSLERLIARLKREQAEASIRDVVRLLDALGWELRSQEGSHMVYVKETNGRLCSR